MEIESSLLVTLAPRRPITESYLSRWVMVLMSPRSFTATISTSAPWAWIARKKIRPMRPNPLTPTRMVMTTLLAVSTACREAPLLATFRDLQFQWLEAGEHLLG